MANINQISLKVCGNPDANSGFQPMVIFNSPLIEIKDTVYAGFGANSYFFTIRIERNQVVYKLIKNNVSSLGASRQGCLVIGIAIPKGYKLDAGISPYDVLMELKKGFLARCMTCKDSVTDKYEFNTNRVQSNILDDIASSFSLVPSQAPYRTMNTGGPIAYVTAPEEKIKQLMNDVQYSAFSKFSEIVVAASVQNTNYTPIANISIPRVAEYSICNDGVLQPKVVSDAKQLIQVDGNGDTRFYENASLIFTLEELLKGESVPNVSIDRANEIINVSSKALIKPLTRKINVVFESKEAEAYFLASKDWALLYGNQTIPLRDLSFELTGEQLKVLCTPEKFKIKQSRKDKYEVRAISVSSNEIRVEAEKVHQTAYTPAGGSKISGGIVPIKNMNVCEVQLLLDKAYNSSRCSVQFYDTDGVCLQSTKVLFGRGNDGNHVARVYVPKSWSGSNIYVHLKYKNESWDSIGPLGKDVNGFIELRDKDFTPKSIGFFSKHLRGVVLTILLLLSLLIGGVIGAYVGITWFGNEKIEYKCSKCDETFTTEKELEDHSEECPYDFYTKTDTLHCPKCKAGPFNQAGLDAHICSMAGDSAIDSASISGSTPDEGAPVGDEYYCETCRKSFQNKTELNNHNDNKHIVKKYPHCGRGFNGSKNLKEHIDEKHHFTCEQCGSDVWFATEQALYVHQRDTKIKGTNRKHERK